MSHLVVGRRTCAIAAGAVVLALGAAAPAKAAGAAIQRLGSVNVGAAAAAAKPAPYRPALRNSPAAQQFAALDERRSDEGADRLIAPALKPPTVAGRRLLSSRQ